MFHLKTWYNYSAIWFFHSNVTHMCKGKARAKDKERRTRATTFPFFVGMHIFVGFWIIFFFPPPWLSTQLNTIRHIHTRRTRAARDASHRTLCVCVFVCFLMVLNSNTQPPSNVSCKFGSVYTVPRMFVALAFFCMYVCIYACKRLLASIYDSCWFWY